MINEVKSGNEEYFVIRKFIIITICKVFLENKSNGMRLASIEEVRQARRILARKFEREWKFG
jgi:hypothetical protein